MNRRRDRIPMGLAGPGIPAAHGYTAEVRAKISATQRGRPHPQRHVRCQCGKSCPAGPMRRHTDASGHRVVSRDHVSPVQ